MDEGAGVVADRLIGREAVLAAAASGKTLKDYCQETGQSYDAMRAWRRKYAAELGLPIRRRAIPSLRSKAGMTKPQARSSVVPIRIGTAVNESAAMVEIRLRESRGLLVTSSIESATLTRLIGAIERAS